MIARFFAAHGSKTSDHCGRNAVEYLVNEIDPKSKELRKPAPEVVEGDPENTIRMIDSLEFKHVYKSGVLSWAPGEKVTLEQEKEAIQKFERVAFAGLEKDQYNILWVRHTHAGHHELHFVTPRVELSTGKSLNIDPPGRANRDAYDLMREAYNLKHGFSDPQAQAQRRELQLPNHVYHQQSQARKLGLDHGKDVRQQVHEYVSGLIEQRLVTNRGELVAALQDASLQVKRQGENYITVVDPASQDEGQRTKGFRLKGEVYERSWELGRTLERARAVTERGADEDRSRKLGELEKRLDRLIEARANYNRSRYQERGRSLNLEHTKTLSRKPPQLSLGRDSDPVWSSDRQLEPKLVPLTDAAPAIRADTDEQHRVDASRRSLEEGLLRAKSQRRKALRADRAGVGLRRRERSILGSTVDQLKEQYDRAREKALGYCREIGQRITRTRDAVNDLLARGRGALERLGAAAQGIERAIQLGPQVLKEAGLRLEQQRQLKYVQRHKGPNLEL